MPLLCTPARQKRLDAFVVPCAQPMARQWFLLLQQWKEATLGGLCPTQECRGPRTATQAGGKPNKHPLCSCHQVSQFKFCWSWGCCLTGLTFPSPSSQSLWAPGRMKRTWRQREAANGVALHQLTSLLQGLQLGCPRTGQVRGRGGYICLRSLCSRWRPGTGSGEWGEALGQKFAVENKCREGKGN